MNAAKEQNAAAQDLKVLHPDATLTIGKPRRDITVREFRFIEGLRMQVLAKPIVEDMVEMFGSTDIEKIGLDQLGELFAKHQDALVAMMCVSADVDEAFIEALDDADGQALFLTFWQVNLLFFVRRLLAKRKERSRAGKTVKPPTANDGAASTPA